MKSLSFLLLLCFFSQASAQEPMNNSSVDKEVALKTEKDSDKDLSLELASDKISLITRTSVELLSSPGSAGVVTGKIKKGVEVQQLDIIGDYYLVCYEGKCGYVIKDDILKISKAAQEKKAEKDSIKVIKPNKF